MLERVLAAGLVVALLLTYAQWVDEREPPAAPEPDAASPREAPERAPDAKPPREAEPRLKEERHEEKPKEKKGKGLVGGLLGAPG